MLHHFLTKRFGPLLDHLLPPVGTMILLFCLILLENALALVSPWLAGQFSEAILHGHSDLSLGYRKILVFWLLLITSQSLLSYFSRVISGSTSEKMVIRLRTRLYDHLQSLPISFFHERKHGNILSLLSYDTSIISTFVSSTVVGIFPTVLTAMGALICIFLINPVIAVLTGLFIPLLVVATRLLGRSIRPLSQKLMQQHGATFSIVEENISTLPLIKSFTREQQESGRFRKSSDELFDLTTRYLKAQARLAPSIRFLSSSMIIIILFIAGDSIASGHITTGQIVSLLLYGLLLTRPMSGLADAYGQTQRAIAAASRLSDIFAEKNEGYSGTHSLSPIKGKVIFRDISFNYPGRNPLFTDLNLSIEPGETIALTGKNGAGKSTLAHLLIRLHTPARGAIYIDDIDISTVSLKSLRSQIGLVQQNVLLRNGSVFDNLRFASPDASMDQILNAARSANALDFIERLPHGFDTIIGDQGVKLSGGQKQRLSLARALLKEPAILILDEATAMFDPIGEEQFIEDNVATLKKLTVIIITHRTASLALADAIYELKDGRLHKQC